MEALVQEEGVDMAMIVSRDGFILEVETGRDLAVEPEQVGAMVSTFWATADGMGKELAAGLGLNGLVEFKEALVSTALLVDDDLILTVVADKHLHPATIRYLTVKFSELLQHVM
jgi:predicted regulator of Ras-like GTPase activity (Roadblock/LC7/MglB family)